MERLPFQVINNNHSAPPETTWQHDSFHKATSSARYSNIKGAADSLIQSDAAHFIASQRMELPGKPRMSQEMASPQSLPPTPKHRNKATENFNPNAFPGIPEDAAALQGTWLNSHKTAADLSRKADKEIKECTESDVSSIAAFDVFSPADWKHQSLRDAGAGPVSLQGLKRGPLQPLEEETHSETAAALDMSSAMQKRNSRAGKGTAQLGEGSTTEHVSQQARRVQQEQQQGTAAAEQPRAPKQTSISLQALARVHQPKTRDEATAANRGGSVAASRAGAGVGAEHAAKEYQRPAQKPKPIRTGLEAPSYPCYIEILQKARLRPERPPGAPPHRRTAAQPTAGGAAKTGASRGRVGGTAAAPRPKDDPPVNKGAHLGYVALRMSPLQCVVFLDYSTSHAHRQAPFMLFICAGDKVAQQAKYAALAAARQALEVKRGQGRPQLRTEQRSAEKIGAASPAAVNVAALLAENQRRLETKVCALGCFPSPWFPLLDMWLPSPAFSLGTHPLASL